MTKKGFLLLGACLGAAFASFNPTGNLTGFSTLAEAAEVPKEIIAVQIRKQGYPCLNPKNATHDGETPLDDARWILHCDGVSYRVTLVPNMAAKVERLPGDAPASSEGAGDGSGQSR
jgi:hypothetical protein